MKRMMIAAVVLMTGIILTVGFFLPQYVLDFRDRQMVGKLDVTSGNISFEAKSELGIIDRLKMMTSAASIPLDNGKNLDPDTACQRALTEFGKFNSKSLLEFDLTDCKMDRNSVSFYIDSADPAKNMIVWNITIQDKGHTLSVDVDDETGKLLRIDYSTQIPYDNIKSKAMPRPAEALLADPAELADSIGDYYGLTVTQLEPEKNVKYTSLLFELSDGQNSMTMTIGLAGYGLWVNI